MEYKCDDKTKALNCSFLYKTCLSTRPEPTHAAAHACTQRTSPGNKAAPPGRLGSEAGPPQGSVFCAVYGTSTGQFSSLAKDTSSRG